MVRRNLCPKVQATVKFLGHHFQPLLGLRHLHHLLQEALQDFPRMSHYTHPSISSPSACLPHGIQVLLNIHFSASLITLLSWRKGGLVFTVNCLFCASLVTLL